MLSRIIKNYDRGLFHPYAMSPQYMEFLLQKHPVVTKEVWERCQRQVSTMIRCLTRTY